MTQTAPDKDLAQKTDADAPDEPPVPDGHVRLTVDDRRIDAPQGSC